LRTPIPILEIDDLLVVSIQIELDDQSALQLQYDLAAKLSRTGSCGIVIDFTAVQVVDSFIAKVVGDIAHITRLMGANLVVTGLNPQVALTLVDLGIELAGVTTALNLQKGIDFLRKKRSGYGR
jgi:rsbT antagonist protein RsbS